MVKKEVSQDQECTMQDHLSAMGLSLLSLENLMIVEGMTLQDLVHMTQGWKLQNQAILEQLSQSKE